MDIRADLTQEASVLPAQWRWVPSPQNGVSRVMLDRVGDEVAVATSFVRYDPESRFPGHGHAKGEEFIVLEGEFGDEHGRYPPGSYIRNPPGSHHVPFSEPGCLIWVKLRQFQPDDQTQLVVRLDTPLPESGHELRELHQHGHERATEVVAAAGESISFDGCERPQELLVLAGEVVVGGQNVPKWGWIRRPAGKDVTVEARTPSRLFWKTRPGE